MLKDWISGEITPERSMIWYSKVIGKEIPRGKQMRLLQVVVQLLCYLWITMFNKHMRFLIPPVCFLVSLAYDLLNTDRNNFNVHIYYNSTYKENSRNTPTTLLRLPRSVNMVRNNNNVLKRSSSLHLHYDIFHVLTLCQSAGVKCFPSITARPWNKDVVRICQRSS